MQMQNPATSKTHPLLRLTIIMLIVMMIMVYDEGDDDYDHKSYDYGDDNDDDDGDLNFHHFLCCFCQGKFHLFFNRVGHDWQQFYLVFQIDSIYFSISEDTSDDY